MERTLMNEIERNIKTECDLFLNRRYLTDKYDIAVIYYNPKDKHDAFAYITDSMNNEEIMLIELFKDDEPELIADWHYNIDYYDFENLQNGYEIAYMSMINHYGFWCTLEQWMPDEIDNVNGLQKYLSYCKSNGITKQVIENVVGLELNEDIMKYHVEENQGYVVIADCNINDKAIVLAESKEAPSPYVTWETLANRNDGYHAGHYFSSLKDAQKDYSKRVNQEVHRTLDSQIDLPTKQKKGQER